MSFCGSLAILLEEFSMVILEMEFLLC